MKKILIIHTKYSSKGGEDISVLNEVELLKTKYDVKEIYFENKINSIMELLFLLTGRNIKSAETIRKSLNTFKPDIVYVHNTWFKASTSIFKLLENYQGKVFIKIHNFRYLCSLNIISKKHVLRDGAYCQGCGKEFKKYLVLNFFYKKNVLKSFILYFYSKRYFKYLKNEKFKILVLTDFHKKLFENITGKKAFTFRNYLVPQTIESVKEDHITYAGRISEEKGVLDLIRVFSEIENPRYKLNIIGTGPLLNKLDVNNKNIIINGERSNQEVLESISASKCIITNTKLFEGQPTLLTEASSLGVPSIFPNTGGLKEIFEDNYPLYFEQFNYKELKKLLESLDDETLNRAGQSAKRSYGVILNSKKIFDTFNLLITG